MKVLLKLLLATVLSASVQAAEPECFPEEVLPENGFPSIKLETSMGDIVIELDHEKAPKTCENFEAYVRDGHYDGTIFHRVINNFMAQGGCPLGA